MARLCALLCAAFSVMSAVVSSRRAGGMTFASSSGVLHIIGDTHGDHNYLVRCLLSTQRFEITADGHVQWAANLEEAENWEVAILGDVVDRGVRSRGNLLLLKALSEHSRWGKRLTVTLGNHESMMLRHLTKYAGKRDEYWSAQKRWEDLTAVEGEGHDLAYWLRNLPVIYMSQGVIMMHGGLKLKVASDYVKTQGRGCKNDEGGATFGEECGKALVEYINTAAREYYQKLHDCYNEKGCDWKKLSDQPPPELDDDGDVGVLWYRGFSSMEDGAGMRQACLDLQGVGKIVGAAAMVLAHTTHHRITRYCPRFATTVFVTDTHPSDCSEKDTSECDFKGVEEFHRKHNSNYSQTHKVPQSLKIESYEEQAEGALGKAESPAIQRVYHACMAHIDADAQEPTFKVSCAEPESLSMVDVYEYLLDGDPTALETALERGDDYKAKWKKCVEKE